MLLLASSRTRRGQESSSTETGYFAQIAQGGNELQVGKYGDGSFTEFATASISTTTDMVWIRFGTVDNGSDVDLKARYWQDGNSEPSSWDIEETDTDPITATGYVGAESFAATTQQWDFVGIGDGFETAPTG